jgi:hypothetical protein
MAAQAAEESIFAAQAYRQVAADFSQTASGVRLLDSFRHRRICALQYFPCQLPTATRTTTSRDRYGNRFAGYSRAVAPAN